MEKQENIIDDERLQRALDETELRDEIISAIAKTYQYISRIDIQADWYEEISNRSRQSLSFPLAGHLSEDNKKVCKKCVAEEYQEAFFQFTDISTLPERMKHEETIALEYRMKDGNWHKLRFIEKKRDEQGNLTHVICAIRSISDQKRREQALISQVAEAKKETALKSRFLSNMSHDIRTPMNGIIGMIDLANRYPDDLEMQQRCRDRIMDASRFLVSLVNDILDMNKLETGELLDQEITFDLTEILNRANTAKQTQAAEKGIEYVVDWDKAVMNQIYLSGNPIYLERLLTAITDNAIKFTAPGGAIHVWCIEKAEENGQVIYEFGCMDNGVGMSEEFLAHAFDVFSQENESSRSRYEGTGLGLAIAQKLAEHMGGRIEIRSQKNVGTTVIMTIPFKLGQKDKIGRITRHREVQVKGMHALLVEDNELNMEIAGFMLEDLGIRVDRAADGLEAVNRFAASKQGEYDIIFMDIMMPHMNGWDAARKIRSMKHPDAGRIPIIAMSANGFVEDIINSRIAGMNEHLVKPVDEKKLLEAITSCQETVWDTLA